MPFLKRAIKYDRTRPGIPCAYLDCECGHKLNIPVIQGMPMSYRCFCGRVYDQRGWLIEDEPTEVERNFRLAMQDADTESREGLEAAADFYDRQMATIRTEEQARIARMGNEVQ